MYIHTTYKILYVLYIYIYIHTPYKILYVFYIYIYICIYTQHIRFYMCYIYIYTYTQHIRFYMCFIYTHTHTHTHTHTLFHVLSHYSLSQDIQFSCPGYTIGPCCLSILYIIVCTCKSQTPCWVFFKKIICLSNIFSQNN